MCEGDMYMTEEEFSTIRKKVRDGFQLWQVIVERYSLLEMDYVIAFPHEETLVNKCGVAYLGRFMKYAQVRKALILYIGNQVPALVCQQTDLGQIEMKRLKEIEMNSLVACYAAVDLSPHFIMMSLTEPNGRYGDKAMRQKGVKMEDVVAFGIYGLPAW